RANGRRKHAHHGVEHFQRLPHALGQSGGRTSRSGARWYPLSCAVFNGVIAVRNDVRHQYFGRVGTAALSQEGVPAMSFPSAVSTPLAPESSQPKPPRRSRQRRPRARTSLLAHGEPMIWLTGGALAIALCMIVGILLFILISGLNTFWPVPIYQI